MHRQGTGNGHTLFLAATERRGIDRRLLSHTHLAQQLDGFGLGLLTRLAEQLDGCQGDVLQDGQMVEEVETLEHHPHTLAQTVDRITLAQDILTIEENFAACRRVEQVQGTQEGTLTCARRTDDADHLAFLDVAVHVLQYLKGFAVRCLKRLAEMFYTNHNFNFSILQFFTILSSNLPKSQARTK